MHVADLQQVVSGKDADDPLRLRGDDRNATDARRDHEIRDPAERVMRAAAGLRRVGQCVGERGIRRNAIDLPAQRIRARNETGERAVFGHNRVAAMARIGSEKDDRIGEGHAAGQHLRLRCHELRGLEKVELVDGVFLQDMPAAPGNFATAKYSLKFVHPA